MDLIKAEVLGLTAHTALSVTGADWVIAASQSDLGEWEVESACSKNQASDEYLLLVKASKSGGADHPETLFSHHGCAFFSTAEHHWICVGWDHTLADQVHLSAGQRRVLESLEQCLSPSANWETRLLHAQDRIGREFLKHATGQVAVVDPDGVLIAISAPLAELFGWPEKSLIHRPIPLVWPGGSGRKGALLSAASRGGEVTTEITLVRKSGDPLQVHANLSSLGDQDYPRVLMTIQV